MDDESVVVSFRINKKLKDALDKECELKKMGTSKILEKIIEKHIEWDRFAEEIGMIFVSKSIFRNLLSNMNEKEIKILASTICRATLKDAIIYMKGKFDISSSLDALSSWISYSGIPFRRRTENGKDSFMIQHELGSKYSTYLSTAVSTLLSEIGYGLKNLDSAEQSLSFDIVKI